MREMGFLFGLVTGIIAGGVLVLGFRDSREKKEYLRGYLNGERAYRKHLIDLSIKQERKRKK